MNSRAVKIAKAWIPLAFVICCLSAMTYLVVQQEYRQSANDPQSQIAEDAAAALSTGTTAQSVIPTGTIQIAESLAPYMVIYDASGKPVAGNGILDGALPSLPAGVFISTHANNGEDRFTWQPEPGVRSAVVVDEIPGSPGGFVMAGRSLREIETRENNLSLEVGAIFIFALLGSLLLVVACAFWDKKS